MELVAYSDLVPCEVRADPRVVTDRGTISPVYVGCSQAFQAAKKSCVKLSRSANPFLGSLPIIKVKKVLLKIILDFRPDCPY